MIKKDTDNQNDDWIEGQEWSIKAIPEDTHTELLAESIEQYRAIWGELAKR